MAHLHAFPGKQGHYPLALLFASEMLWPPGGGWGAQGTEFPVEGGTVHRKLFFKIIFYHCCIALVPEIQIPIV